MVHHPIILGTKVVVLLIIVTVLILLHGVLSPEQFKVAVVAGAVLFAVAVLAIWIVAIRMLGNPDSKLARQMILSAPSRGEEPPPAEEGESLASMVGAEGVAVSDLRPSGVAVFGEKRLQVMSDATYVPKGARIKIVVVKGSRVTIERL